MRDVCGNKVIVATGLERMDFNKVVSFNETAAYLWESLEGKEFTAETMASLLLERYDVDGQRAADDAAALLKTWIEVGLVEE